MKAVFACFALFSIKCAAQFGYSQEQLDMYDLYDELQHKYEKPMTFYEFLEIDPLAKKREIKSGYRKKAVIYHPDKANKDTLPEKYQTDSFIEMRFRHLASINEILLNEELRQAYDDVLKNGLPPGMSFRHYRYMLKLSVKQVSVFLLLIFTLVHYMCLWARWLEKTWIIQDRSKASKRKAKQLESIVLPKPTWRDSLPVLIICLVKYLITQMPSDLKGYLNEAKNQQMLKKLEAERQKKADEDYEKEKERKLEQKKINQIKHQEWLEQQRVENAERYNKMMEEAAARQAEMDAELDDLDVSYSDSDEDDDSKKRRRQKKNKKQVKKFNYGESEEVKTGPWSEEDLQKLTELTNKWPGGTPDRWERIAEELCRTVTDVNKKMKFLKQKVEKTVLKEEKGLEISWTQEQQSALEQALAAFKKDYEGDRWEEISKCVQGKDKKECIERYKFIVMKLKEKKG